MENIELTEVSKSQSFRILSLDGGGVMGTYTAAVLAGIETMTKKRIADHFDLIVGTSTGGIIAVALGMGIPAEKILSLYVDHGPSIFPRPRFGRFGKAGRWLRKLFRPKFNQTRLKQVFEEIVGNKRYGESGVRLVIPAFNADAGKIHLFKTAHKHEYKQDHLRLASEIILATSAAPTYYPASTNIDGTCYLDGGVWANCPVMVGILEAVCSLKQPIESVTVLSIGTTSAPYHVGSWRRKGGLISWGWNGEAATMFLQAQTSAALGQARLLIGDKLVRIDNITRSNRFAMDDASAIPSLRSLGQEDARQNESKVNELFLNTKVVPFVPCHTGSKTQPTAS